MSNQQQDEEAGWARLRAMPADDYVKAFNEHYARLEAQPGREPYLVTGKMDGGGANPYALSAPSVVMASDYEHAFLKVVMENTGGHISHLLTPYAINTGITFYEEAGWDLVDPALVVMRVLLEDRIDEDGQKYVGYDIYDHALDLNMLLEETGLQVVPL